MDDSTERASPPWYRGRSAKQRAAVQRNVTALLDAVAPERVGRAEAPVVAIERHRTPTGCVLQAPTAAVSVSWFGDDTQELGELHILLWSGVVTRRGAPVQREGASVQRQIVLSPIDPPRDGCVWQARAGKAYDTESLVAHVSALLQDEMARAT